MDKIRVYVEDNKVYLKLHYRLKDLAKDIPGHKWISKKKAWSFPATAATACNIINKFMSFERDEEFTKLENLFLARKLAHQYLDSRHMKWIKNPLREPPISIGDTWHHQLQAYYFIASLWGGISNSSPRGGALLAYDMGTGKSRVAIQLIENFKLEKVLILCPKSVMEVWPDEFEKHGTDLGFISSSSSGSVKYRSSILADIITSRFQFVAIVNYDAAWRGDMKKVILDTKWDLVILDEAHRIKSHASKISKFCAELANKVPARLAMTGTPLPHSPLDAFALYRFLDAGIFGLNYYKFRDEFAILGGFENKQVVAFKNLDELHDRMYSITTRVTKEECLDLPELIHERLTCRLQDKTQKIYTDIENDFYSEVSTGEVTVSNVLVKILRLQQITSGHITNDDGKMLWIDDSKEKLLEEFLSNISLEEAIVVFCRFRNDLDAVHRVCERSHRISFELSGRKNQLKEWKQYVHQKKGYRFYKSVLAVQIQSGGVGIDLTRACYAVYYSVGYSLSDYLQSVSRLHRHGQKRPVTCYHLVASGTIDEKVYKALKKREEIIDSVLEK